MDGQVICIVKQHALAVTVDMYLHVLYVLVSRA
jgi:hypothetical protein